MTDLSYYITTQNLEQHEMEPYAWTKGTSAPGSGDVEVRFVVSNFQSHLQMIRALQSLIRYLEDGETALRADDNLV